jgi:hypothetical protein
MQVDIFELCINQECTVREALSLFYASCHRIGLMSKATENITAEICGWPLRDRTRSVSVTGIVGISLAMMIFLLRIIARTKTHQFGMDDWTMIMAMVPKTDT